MSMRNTSAGVASASGLTLVSALDVVHVQGATTEADDDDNGTLGLIGLVVRSRRTGGTEASTHRYETRRHTDTRLVGTPERGRPAPADQNRLRTPETFHGSIEQPFETCRAMGVTRCGLAARAIRHGNARRHRGA